MGQEKAGEVSTGEPQRHGGVIQQVKFSEERSLRTAASVRLFLSTPPFGTQRNKNRPQLSLSSFVF